MGQEELAALPALAASGAPSIALALSGVGALICHRSGYDPARRFVPWIVAGDLNAEPDDQAVRTLLAAGLRDVFAPGPPAPGLHRLQLYSGGTEAVESALRLAKSHTGKYEFIGFWGGFHGKTMGSLSLMGSTFKHRLGPMVPGAHQGRAS